tara:strand:- start:427 stop:564 length:138 start_codon:yes stop_codon:yes gene_type:complete
VYEKITSRVLSCYDLNDTNIALNNSKTGKLGTLCFEKLKDNTDAY